MSLFCTTPHTVLFLHPSLAGHGASHPRSWCLNGGNEGGVGHCDCPPGVGGSQCDRCLPEFWGFKFLLRGDGGSVEGCRRAFSKDSLAKHFLCSSPVCRFDQQFLTVPSIFFLACACSRDGSVRPDCDQTTGRCVCKPGISGPKCDVCPDGTKVAPSGCSGRELCFPYKTQNYWFFFKKSFPFCSVLPAGQL